MPLQVGCPRKRRTASKSPELVYASDPAAADGTSTNQDQSEWPNNSGTWLRLEQSFSKLLKSWYSRSIEWQIEPPATCQAPCYLFLYHLQSAFYLRQSIPKKTMKKLLTRHSEFHQVQRSPSYSLASLGPFGSQYNLLGPASTGSAAARGKISRDLTMYRRFDRFQSFDFFSSCIVFTTFSTSSADMAEISVHSARITSSSEFSSQTSVQARR